MGTPKIDYDDKDLVIFAVFVICTMSLLALEDKMAVQLIEKALYGLFGIVTGKAIGGAK